MSDTPRYQRFFADLKRRRVFRVMAVFGAVAFGVIQAADIMLPRMGLPDWSVTLVVWLCVLGFPAAVALAWAFDRTPEGLRRTADAETEEIDAIVAEPRGRRWSAGLFALAGTVLLLAAVGGWYTGRRSADGARSGDPASAAVSVAGEGAAAALPVSAGASLAVLPFSNLSGDDEAQPFADGLHDDLLTQLSRIASLKVISRTSVLEYRNTTKNVREIAGELGVQSVLEGGVQKAGDRFRLNVQLIDADSDTHLWAKTYGGELTTANIFDVQAEIADEITTALRAQLSPEVKAEIASPPTEDVEAYQAYLAAYNRWESSGLAEGGLRAAEGLASLALARDSAFAEAWALKSLISGEQYWMYYDRSDSIRDVIGATARRALELQPDLPLGHLAMAAYWYRIHLDYERALGEIDRFLELHPATTDAEGLAGAILRRQGKDEEALRRFERAVELDPRDAGWMMEAGATAYLLRRHAEAENWLQRCLALKPDFGDAYVYLAANTLRADGDTAGARAWLEQARTAGVYEFGKDDFTFLDVAWAARQPDRMIEESERMRGPVDNQYVFMPAVLWRALAWRMKEDPARAHAAFDSARVELEAASRADPAEPRVRSALGIAYAGLGRKADALREGEEGVRLMPPEKEAWRGGFRVLQLARIEAMVGEDERAIGHLKQLLSVPFDLTVAEMQLDPGWDPLRENPKFEALVGG